jgi:hypothetical protein
LDNLSWPPSHFTLKPVHNGIWIYRNSIWSREYRWCEIISHTVGTVGWTEKQEGKGIFLPEHLLLPVHLFSYCDVIPRLCQRINIQMINS